MSVSFLVLSGDFSCSFNWKCFFILLLFLWLSVFRSNSYLLWCWRAVLMWEHPCVACVCLLVLLCLVWMPATSFFCVCWLLSPYWQAVCLVVWRPESALDVDQGLLFALWFSHPCWGPDLLPSCRSRGPQICFWAAVWGRQTWSTFTRGELLTVPLQEMSTEKCPLWCLLSPIVRVHEV